MKDKGKELQDALDRLERCCPGSTSGSSQTASAALHAALLNLERARNQEQQLREEADALLKGMDIIISSESTRTAFNMVLEVMQGLLSFDDAFVLREQKNGLLSTVASTSPRFENLVWPPSAMLKHVLSGNSVNIRDISNSTDWQGQPQAIRQHVTAALHTPFNTTTERAMLVCTNSREGFFNKSSIQFLERFSPLAGQALYNLEINDLLRDEISERKQVEENLEAALTDLQNMQEELITANEALSQEIRDRQKAEDALKKAYDDLELRVEQRTAELRSSNLLLQSEINERRRAEEEKEKMFAQLLQSQKMESVGLLAGGIAHDFNNILTTILGYSELSIITMSKDDPLRPQMEAIHAAGEQASELTRQLLAFSRKQMMETKIINLNTLITNMTKMLSRLIGENIELQLSLKEQIGNIKADPGQIEQVLMNMAVNSRDAMPHGGLLSIRTADVFFNEEEAAKHTGMGPGAYVVLSVEDTGEGMTEEVQKEIFEPFFTTKARGKGTGLGLATVYGIVKQHNSYINFNSEQGQGTIFSIYFPLTEEGVPERELALLKPDTLRRATETVLVADDNASIRSFVTDTLTPLGYTCLSAANGKEALQLVQTSKETIDLLLTDVVMPLMNGPELATLLKKQSPKSKVIFMSGYMSNVDFNDIIARSDAFLQKPLTPSKLLNKFAKVLGA
jgi:signal transduction histidine kinase/galactitol-specific phosphotransferase system IIB component